METNSLSRDFFKGRRKQQVFSGLSDQFKRTLVVSNGGQAARRIAERPQFRKFVPCPVFSCKHSVDLGVAEADL